MLYKSREEIAKYATDNTVEFVNEFLNAKTNEEKTDIYTIGLCFIGAWDAEQKRSFIDRAYRLYDPDQNDVYTPGLFISLPAERTKEDADVVNSVLHVLHGENSNIRKEAIEKMQEYKKNNGIVYLSQESVRRKTGHENMLDFIAELNEKYPDVLIYPSERVPGFHDYFYQENKNWVDEYTLEFCAPTQEDIQAIITALKPFGWRGIPIEDDIEHEEKKTHNLPREKSMNELLERIAKIKQEKKEKIPKEITSDKRKRSFPAPEEH